MSKSKLTESNLYTIGFAFLMSLVVAGGLAALKLVLGPQQEANELNFTKEQILGAVMDVEKGTDVESIFNQRVKGEILNNKGEVISDDVNEALSISLYKEAKRDPNSRRFPIYIFNEGGDTKYIIPTVGKGLWDAIMSYTALESDKNTIAGVTFDHIGETPGLGAKIKDDPGFYQDFKGEKIFDDQGKLVGVKVRKGNNDPLNTDKEDHTIDAISGATITGDGVEDMLINELTYYLPYLEKK